VIINLKKYKESSINKSIIGVLKKMFLSLNQPVVLDLFSTMKKVRVYQGYPKYLVDPLSSVDLCTTCRICESICPVNSIKIIEADDGFSGPIDKAPKEFMLDLMSCVKCGFCIDECPEGALSGNGEVLQLEFEEKIIDLKKKAHSKNIST